MRLGLVQPQCFGTAFPALRSGSLAILAVCLAALLPARSLAQARPAPPELVEHLAGATVYIESQLILAQADWNAFPADAREKLGRPHGPASGSGFIVSEDGYIVTNAHVIGDMQQPITLKDGSKLNWHFVSTSLSVVVHSGEANEQTYLPHVVKVNQALDLAVLKITPQSPLKPLSINPAQEVKGGFPAVMAGFPGGKAVGFAPFADSAQRANADEMPNPRVALNSGAISAVRSFKGSVRYQLAIGANHGNSGGPITNNKGEVIGVLYAGIDGMDSINYAIPARYLKSVLPTSITANWPATPADETPAAGDDGQKFDDFVGSGTFKLAK